MKEKIERNAIIIGVVVCLIMAIAGWLTYYFSKSEAMFLDGNFSFLGGVSYTSGSKNFINQDQDKSNLHSALVLTHFGVFKTNPRYERIQTVKIKFRDRK